MRYFDNLGDEALVTIDDLRIHMGTLTDDPYSNKWIKNWMKKKYKDTILITSVCGRKDVVVDSHAASTILVREKEKDGNFEREIDISAARLIANDIRRMDYDKESFLDLNELNISDQHGRLPEHLRVFLQELKSKRSKSDDTLRQAFLGQSLINLTDRRVPTPLLTSLGVQASLLTGCSHLIFILEKLGASCSNYLVSQFERNAAIMSVDIGQALTLAIVRYALWIADNMNVK